MFIEADPGNGGQEETEYEDAAWTAHGSKGAERFGVNHACGWSRPRNPIVACMLREVQVTAG